MQRSQCRAHISHICQPRSNSLLFEINDDAHIWEWTSLKPSSTASLFESCPLTRIGQSHRASSQLLQGSSEDAAGETGGGERNPRFYGRIEGLILSNWRARILIRIIEEALNEAASQKDCPCASLYARLCRLKTNL